MLFTIIEEFGRALQRKGSTVFLHNREENAFPQRGNAFSCFFENMKNLQKACLIQIGV